MHLARTRTRGGIALLAVAVALALPGSALAGSPPNGTYTCTTYSPSFGNQFAGTLRIVSESKYTVNKGKKGAYSVKGKRIKFKTGSYKGVWVGNWAKKNVIYLAQPSTPKENDVTCSRGK